MSEADGLLETESPPETEAGFCLPFDERLLDADDEPTDEPEPQAPPMANVALAIELCTGLDAVRDYEFHGVTYRLNPTPYDVGLRLLAWSQELERLALLRDELHEHLPALRTCYAEVLRLIGSLLTPPLPPDFTNPFFEADAQEVRALLGFALVTGNEVAIRTPKRTNEDPVSRYDAAFYLLKYLDRFGDVPGMVTAKGAPATWRHFSAAMAYMRRADAEAAMSLFGTYGATQSTEEGQERWLDLQRREAGL